jgi:hypothetical protein
LINQVKSKVGLKGTEEPIGVVVTAAATAAGSQAVLATITAAIPLITSLLAVTGDIFKKVEEIKAGTAAPPPPGAEPPVVDPEADNTKKYIMYGGIALLGVGAVYYFSKKRKN